jgi:transcriptional regulator with XRE-family HTH domain
VDARIFGEELRKHCQRFGSISAVCEGAGINRQQFNKYLCGQMLPSARSMRKICGFLGVSEEQLFTGRGVAEQPAQPPRAAAEPAGPYMGSNELITLLATQRLSQLTGGAVTSGAGAIPEGYYYCYFPLHSSSSVLVRSLISVRQRGGVLMFSRRTNAALLDRDRRFVTRGKHAGVVLVGPTEASFLAINQFAPYQLSHIAVDLEPLFATNYYSGLAVTRKNRGQIATNVVLQFLSSDGSKRHLLRSIGPVDLGDSSVDPIVRLMLTAKTTSGNNQIQAIDVDDLLRNGSPASFQRAKA